VTGRAAIGMLVGFAVACATVPAASPARSSALASPRPPLIKVSARIRSEGPYPSPLKVFFTPSVVNVGTILFVITNSDNGHHFLQIGGVSSRMMGPTGGKAVMRVTFKKPGIYGVATNLLPGEYLDGGSITVVK